MASDQLSDIAFAFLSILFEGAPFIFVGTLISGFIDAYLPPGLIDRWLPRKPVLAVMVRRRGALVAARQRLWARRFLPAVLLALLLFFFSAEICP